MQGQTFPRSVTGYDFPLIKGAWGIVQYPNYLEINDTNGPGEITSFGIRVHSTNYTACLQSWMLLMVDGVTINYGWLNDYITTYGTIPFWGVQSAVAYTSGVFTAQGLLKVPYYGSVQLVYYPDQALGNVEIAMWLHGTRGT